jgi:glycosyltransferase involved in cell wall biosynthesis
MRYVLISAAHNEESFIQNTLDSVCSQSLLPERWIVVDDGSTDRTAQIVRTYSKRFAWIELLSRPSHRERNFAAKVHAFAEGLSRIRRIDYEVIGNLDADVSFEADYLDFLIRQFAADPALGVAGTPFLEEGYDSARHSFEGVNHVAGGVQLFRRKCFDDIGGYRPNRAGGIDWIAVTTARMKGWKTQSFPEKRFIHHRRLGTATRGTLASIYAHGEKDYYLGGSPVWQLLRAAYRMKRRPVIVGGLALALGYGSAALRRIPLAVSPELMRFHRAEQWTKLKAILYTLMRLRAVEPFSLGSSTADR